MRHQDWDLHTEEHLASHFQREKEFIYRSELTRYSIVPSASCNLFARAGLTDVQAKASCARANPLADFAATSVAKTSGLGRHRLS